MGGQQQLVNLRPISETTTLDNGLESQVQTDYETFSLNGATFTRLNPTEEREYDYGSGGPGPLLRKTDYTYLHTNSQTYLNLNIVDRVTGVIVYNGSGTQLAQTIKEYDNYTQGIQAPPGNPVQHDSSFGTSYTTRGNLTATSRWLNTTNTSLTTRNQYNELGEVISTTDPSGHTTQFGYGDSWSNTACAPASGSGDVYVTSITNALTQTSTFTYDSCTGLLAGSTDVNSRTTSHTYDLLGRLATTTYSDGGSTTNCYTDNINETCYSNSFPLKIITSKAISSSLNLVKTALYDGLGRVSETQLTSDPQGVVYVDTTYDGLGRVATASNPYRSTSDPTYGITAYIYDGLDRTTQVTESDGSTVSTVYSGNCATVTDEQGKTREGCTDGLDHLTSAVEDPGGLGYITSYTYNALDDLLSVVQNGSRQRNFTYNSLSQMTQATNPESGTVTYAYDADGNVTSKTDARSITTTNTYDVLNRLSKRQYSDATSTVYLNYDGNTQSGCTAAITDSNPKGYRTGMCDGAGSEAWSHDQMGRTLNDQRVTNGVTKTISYTYAPFVDGSIDKITYPSGLAVTYTYDGAERPASATDSNGNSYALNATYAPQGALQTATLSATPLFAGFSVLNSYTPRLQPNEIKTTAPSGTTLEDFVYCFSALAGNPTGCPSPTGDNGNVMRIVNNVSTTRSQMFTYDLLNRLATAGTVNLSGTNCWDESYGYDPWGNLLSIGSVSGYSGCTQPDSLSIGVSAQNQINSPTGYGYDAAGNLIAAPGGATYAYDAENQMTSAAGVTYTYDGDGNRVEKSNGTLFWYGMGSDALEETNTSGALTNDYIFFGGQRIARRDTAGDIFTYFADHLGSSRKMMKIASGASSSTTAYDADFYPFGRENAFTNTNDPIHRFTGKQRDSESGLDDFGARYYSSTIGRFMSPDPTVVSATPSNPQTWNRYTYVLDNPSTNIDTNGKWTKGEHEAIINDVFNSMSDGDRTILKQASAEVDRDQDPNDSYRHGMSGPHESAFQASQDAGQFIDTNINAAVAAQLAWEDAASSPDQKAVRETLNAPDALRFFGTALHTVTDVWSPEHVGFQTWHGWGLAYSPIHNAQALYHVTMEKHDGGSTGVSNVAARQMAEYEARLLWDRYQSLLKQARKKREQKKPKPTSAAPAAMASVAIPYN